MVPFSQRPCPFEGQKGCHTQTQSSYPTKRSCLRGRIPPTAPGYQPLKWTVSRSRKMFTWCPYLILVSNASNGSSVIFVKWGEFFSQWTPKVPTKGTQVLPCNCAVCNFTQKKLTLFLSRGNFNCKFMLFWCEANFVANLCFFEEENFLA